MSRARTSYLSVEAHGFFARIHAEDVAEMTGRHVRTVRRWLRGEQEMPETARRTVEVLGLGILPWSGWEGFAVDPRGGKLWSPNGYGWSAGELQHWGIVMQRVAYWRRVIADAGVPSGPLGPPS